MLLSFRKLHRRIAPILFLPLLASALTGIAYRIGRSSFKIPGNVAEWLMVIHQGEYLSQPLVPVYVLLVGLGLLGMIATGLTMIFQLVKRQRSPNSKLNVRQFHRTLAPFIFLPLIISAVTGIVYRLGKSWFGMSNAQAAIVLRIHQGSYLGDFWRQIYVLLIGIGLIAMLFTGINMTGIFRRRRQSANVTDSD